MFVRRKSLSLHHDLRKSVICGVEQLAARWAHNPKVVCSSQTSATLERRCDSSLFFVPIRKIVSEILKSYFGNPIGEGLVFWLPNDC